MVIILLQRGQLQNYPKGDVAELENYLWVRVESRLLKKNCQATYLHAWQELGRSFPLAEQAITLSSTILYPRMLLFFLAAKTARTPRSWPEILFFRLSLVISVSSPTFVGDK